jgi:glutathione peroxidase
MRILVLCSILLLGTLLGAQSLYTIRSETIQGRQLPLKGYEGRVLLIVNITTDSPLTKQLSELQILYSNYVEQGLSILAFPTSDFANQPQPNTQEIIKTCYETYKVGFPIFMPSHVTGSQKNEVYQFLTDSETNPMYGGEVTFDFVKFLVNREGKVIGRFATTTSPNDPKLIQAIENALGANQ